VTVTIGAEAASIKFKAFGFCAIIPANGSAYSAQAPDNCGFAAPYTSSSSLNPETFVPTASTIPDSSEPLRWPDHYRKRASTGIRRGRFHRSTAGRRVPLEPSASGAEAAANIAWSSLRLNPSKITPPFMIWTTTNKRHFGQRSAMSSEASTNNGGAASAE
jgi:hypothetical protein